MPNTQVNNLGCVGCTLLSVHKSLCVMCCMLISYFICVVCTIGGVLHHEFLNSPLSLLKHARPSIRGKVKLFHHHVLWNADLLSQVQTSWHNMTEKLR